VVISASESNREVVIEIADTGTGIAPAELPSIFERFRRGTGAEGVGLGLPIAKAAVDVVGGAIEIDSHEGSGTIARIRLPGAPPGTAGEPPGVVR
jgi:signal transduction histidine kinase